MYVLDYCPLLYHILYSQAQYILFTRHIAVKNMCNLRSRDTCKHIGSTAQVVQFSASLIHDIFISQQSKADNCKNPSLCLSVPPNKFSPQVRIETFSRLPFLRSQTIQSRDVANNAYKSHKQISQLKPASSDSPLQQARKQTPHMFHRNVEWRKKGKMLPL